jgi:hypothetical protein
MLNRTTTPNLTPVAVTSIDPTDKNTPERITETIHSGLKMLTLTKDIPAQKLLKVAATLGQNVSQNKQSLPNINPQAMTQLINPLFENRNLKAVIALTPRFALRTRVSNNPTFSEACTCPVDEQYQAIAILIPPFLGDIFNKFCGQFTHHYAISFPQSSPHRGLR